MVTYFVKYSQILDGEVCQNWTYVKSVEGANGEQIWKATVLFTGNYSLEILDYYPGEASEEYKNILKVTASYLESEIKNPSNPYAGTWARERLAQYENKIQELYGGK